jgi:hypothetical protein
MELINQSYYSDNDNKKVMYADFVYSKGFIIGKTDDINLELNHNSGIISPSRLAQIWSFFGSQEILNNTGCNPE